MVRGKHSCVAAGPGGRVAVRWKKGGQGSEKAGCWKDRLCVLQSPGTGPMVLGDQWARVSTSSQNGSCRVWGSVDNPKEEECQRGVV